MRARWLVASIALAAIGCRSNPPPPASPTSTTSANLSAPPTSTETEADQPTLPEAPKLGFLERRADGTCWYGTSPAGPLQRVVTCPPTMFDASQKSPPTEAADTGGYLERVIESGTCWWSLHAPYDCPAGSVCKPDPPVSRVRCP